MTRKLIAALGLLALVSPALGDDDAPYYDEQSGAWVNDGPPPPEAEQQYAPDPQTNVDVSVDLAAPGASVSFGTFHDPLAQYGQWVTVGSYGRVWRPMNVAAGWRPYFYGRWEWTDEGWLWVSDEPWGWAAYHYGRWANDPYYGWVWIPGYQWAPAWVTWRYSPDYIGWAPLGPGFSVYVTSYPVNYGWWTFVPCRRFVGVPIHTIAYTGGYVRGIFHGTQPAPPRSTVYGVHAPAWGGPARPFVEQRVGRPITPVRLQPVASPAAVRGAARPGVVPVYRPEARAAPAPGRAQAVSGGPAGPRAAAPSGGFRSPANAQRPQGGVAPAPARPQPSAGPGSAPVRQQGSAPPRAPQGGVAPARPQQMNAPARPQQMNAPARPQQMNAPARPQGNHAPAPARPQQGGAAPAPSRAPAQPPGQNRPQGFFAPRAPRQQAYAAAPARAPAFASAPSPHAAVAARASHQR